MSDGVSLTDNTYRLPYCIVHCRPQRRSKRQRKLQTAFGARLRTQVHSKQLLVALILVCATVMLAGCGTSASQKVASVTGNANADCSFTGRMLVGGTSEKVYQCSDKSYQTIMGCYAIHGDEVADISKQFQALIKLQDQSIDCGY